VNILIIYPYLPHEKTYHGSAIRVQNYLKYLSCKNKIFLACFADRKNKELIDDLKQYCEKIVYANPPKKLNHFSRIYGFLFSRSPNFIRHFYSEELIDKINALIAEFPIDIIHIDLILLADYLNLIKFNSKIKTVLNIDEVISKTLILKRKRLRLLMKLITYFQYLKIRNYELKMCRRVHKILTVTSDEKEYLKFLDHSIDISIIPNGLDSSFYQFDCDKELENIPDIDILYLGNYQHYPNIEAVLYFHKYIFPLVKNVRSEIIFGIIGANVPDEVNKLATDPSVKVIGQVKDVRPYIKKSKVFICPVISGGGMRGKVLEAMALEVPIISTRLGVSGISIRNKVHLFVEDKPDKFADRIIEILNGESKRIQEMTIASRRVVEEKYFWQIVCKMLEDEYKKLTKKDGHRINK